MLYELQQPGVITQRHIAALGWKSVRPRRSLEKHASCRLPALSPVAARMILWAQDDIRVPGRFWNGASLHCQNLRSAPARHSGSTGQSAAPFSSSRTTVTRSSSNSTRLGASPARIRIQHSARWKRSAIRLTASPCNWSSCVRNTELPPPDHEAFQPATSPQLLNACDHIQRR